MTAVEDWSMFKREAPATTPSHEAPSRLYSLNESDYKESGSSVRSASGREPPERRTGEGPGRRRERVEIFANETTTQGIFYWLAKVKKTPYKLVAPTMAWSVSITSHNSRVFFFIAWLGLLVGSCVVIYNTLASFLTFGTAISINEELVASLDLPGITVCPYGGGIRRSKVSGSAYFLRAMNADPERYKVVQQVCYNETGPDPFPDEYTLFSKLTDVYDNRVMSMLAEESGFALSDYMLSCQLSEVAVPCQELFFARMTEDGECFTMNFNGSIPASSYTFVRHWRDAYPLRSVTRPGLSTGLSLRLHAQTSELCMTEDGFAWPFAGFTIAVHDQNALPTSMDQAIAVQETNIDRALTENLGRCSSKDELKLYKGVPYNRDSCLVECLALEVWKNCSCLITQLSVDLNVTTALFHSVHPIPVGQRNSFWADVPVCYGNANGAVCMADRMREFHKGHFAQNCSSHSVCPDACLRRRFSWTSSTARFPPPNLLPLLRADVARDNGLRLTDQAFQQNILEVDVFFAELRVRRITESWAMTYTALLSNLGGALGLFLGVSLFSVVETAAFAVDLLFGWIPNTAA